MSRVLMALSIGWAVCWSSCFASSEAPSVPDYQQLLFPNGLPQIKSYFSGLSVASHFLLLGDAKAGSGDVYVLYSLAAKKSADDTHLVSLARLRDSRVIEQWDLTGDVPLWIEMPGVASDVRGCVSYSSELQVLHVSLWSLLSGTGSSKAVSELYWSTPLPAGAGVQNGIHLRKVAEWIREGPTRIKETNPAVSLARVRSTGLPVVMVDHDSGELRALRLNAAGEAMAVDRKQVEVVASCGIDLLTGRPR